MKNIVISGYFGFDNIGDEAILYETIKLLKENNINPIVLSKNPNKTMEEYSTSSIQRDNFNLVIKTIKNSNGLISGGGSLLQDVTSWRNIPYYLFIIEIANFFKKPIYFHAQGIGPLNKRLSSLMVKNSLKKCETLSVRDINSAKIIKEDLKIKKNLEIINDPALFLKKEEKTLLPEHINDFLNKRPLFLSIKNSKHNNKVLNEMKSFLKEIKKDNIPIISLPFHYRQDLEITKNILKDYPNKIIIEDNLTISQILEIIENCNMVLGTRLHSLILSANRITPFIGISYDPKIDEFLSQFNKKPTCYIEEIDKNKLLKEFYKTIDNYNEIKEDIRKKIEEKTLINEKYNRLLIEKIKGNQKNN